MLMSPATPARDGENGAIRARRGSTRTERPGQTTVSPKQVATIGDRRIAEIQRARILSAMLDSATELRAGSVSIADIVERAGVSRRTFYELFVDREACFHAGFEQALSDVADRVASACCGETQWRERIRVGLVALLCFFDREPRVGRFLITESLAGGKTTLARRNEAIAKLTHFVEEGANEGKGTLVPPPLTGEGVVGGVLAVIQRRLAEESHPSLVELANPLMSMIVLPYLGSAAARRELQRATPAPSPIEPERVSAVDPFKGAGMRLTYRTVRVLMAITEHPGASNRLIGETAEVKDQGQISKLLARLSRAGMVCNSGLGPGTGAPNAWTLTPSGRQVTDSIRMHTEGSQNHAGHER
jgi:AcrR family transcriptional regulator